MSRASIRAAAAALAVLLLGSPLPAYLVRRTAAGGDIRWNLANSAPNVVGGKVTYYIDQASAQDVTGPQFAAAIRNSIQSWEDDDASSIAFLEDNGRPTTVKNSSDHINRFGFSSGVLPPFAFAAAFTAVTSGRITDVDVVYNPEMTWSVQTPGSPSKADVEAVTTHEWGHGIGLDHVPAFRSTMYFSASLGQLSLRSLETDDLAGAARSYPADDLDASRGRILGRVDVAGTSDDRGIQVTAIDFVTGFPAASAITEPSGEYEILGLPPGVYRLVASPMGRTKIDGGVYSPFWNTAATGILPAVRGKDGAADGSTGAVVLQAGQALAGMDLSVAVTADPGEPNDTVGTARPTALGRSIAGRIESNNDHDVFSFAGVAGRTVSVFVHAAQIGSDLDPRLFLRAPNGTVLASNDDLATAAFDVEGADPDCRIRDFTLPSTGTYFVEIEAASSVGSDPVEDFFYVLTLLEGGVGEASPYTSELTASPAVVPADGVSASTVTFRPLTLQATEIGAGKGVTFALAADGDADGVATAPLDHGDGTYSITLTAPASPGSDVVRALVDGNEIATATVTWRGPADFAASGFRATPRRIRFHETATAGVLVTPRDVNGVPLGAGRSVVLSLPGALDSSIGSVEDEGDGTYAALLTGGDVPEDLSVEATVDGVPLDGSWFVGVGFPLEPVVEDAVADLQAALAGNPAPSAKAIPALTKAKDLLFLAEGLAPASVLPAVQKGVRQLETASKRGTDASALARELAEAARQAAREALDQAGPKVDVAKEIAALAKAESLFDKGEALLDAGSLSKAAAKYAAALKAALKVQ